MAVAARPAMVTQEDRNLVYKHTSTNSLPTLKKVVEFMEDRPLLLAEGALKMAAGAAAGAISGSIAGAVVGALVPVAAPFSVKAGAALGGAIGAATVAKMFIEGPKVSQMYKHWKGAKIGGEVGVVFAKYLPARAMMQFSCPLSRDVIRVPVRDDDGNVYEYSTVMQQANPPPNLRYDENYHRTFLAVLKPIFENPQVLQQDGLTFAQYRERILAGAEEIVSHESQPIVKACLRGDMKGTDAVKKLLEIIDRYKIA